MRLLSRLAACGAIAAPLLSAGIPTPGSATGLPATPVAASWTDLVTPLQQASPRMRFHAGGIDPATNQPLVLPALPDIPGAASDWYVAQWQQKNYLDAGMAHALPRGAGWSFATADGHSSVQINRADDPLGIGYHLFERGGILTSGGGSNLFLTAPLRTALPAASYGNPVQLRIGTRIEDAFVRYDTPTAKESGAVLAMAFVGTGALFLPPPGSTDAAQFVFVQVPVTVSKAVPSGPGIICSVAGNQPLLLYAPPMASLAFRADGRIQTEVVDMQDVIRGMVSRPYPCGGRSMGWSAAKTDVRNWYFTGLYAGLKVQDTDTRAGSVSPAPQGRAELGLEVTELSVRRRSAP
ncbi:MAG: hypothetical protein INR65_15705 [Gluconacetobacter diazotrophicus]|nr:hypothetical protein [Gluconacetobacter diazotrophicus]